MFRKVFGLCCHGNVLKPFVFDMIAMVTVQVIYVGEVREACTAIPQLCERLACHGIVVGGEGDGGKRYQGETRFW